MRQGQGVFGGLTIVATDVSEQGLGAGGDGLAVVQQAGGMCLLGLSQRTHKPAK